MSLASTLAQAIRPPVPPAVLGACRDGDRAVVENILYVALEIVPHMSIDLATCEASAGAYRVTVPLAGAVPVALSALKRIAAFSPCRVEDIILEPAQASERWSNRVVLVICDEVTRPSFSEFDIVRVSKRTRR